MTFKDKGDINNMRVLVVEDSLSSQLVFSEILKKMNIDFGMCDNGYDAILKSNNENYDLILMDVQMPILNGIEAMKQIKENKKDIKIIAVTADAMKGTKEKLLNYGFDYYISKPFQVFQLKDIINMFLKTPG